jgi:hypothetical protein
MVLFAAFVLILCGLIHSILGEKYLLIRLFKRDNLPHLYGSDAFTKGTLRFTWHITSFAWFGLAALLIFHHLGDFNQLLNVIAVVFLASSICSAFFTKGKHFSWLLFLLVSISCYISV